MVNHWKQRRFETVQKLQGSQARVPGARAFNQFETVQKLQGSQAHAAITNRANCLRLYRNYKVLKRRLHLLPHRRV